VNCLGVRLHFPSAGELEKECDYHLLGSCDHISWFPVDQYGSKQPFPGNILLNERQVVQVKLDETVYNKKKQHKNQAYMPQPPRAIAEVMSFLEQPVT